MAAEVTVRVNTKSATKLLRRLETAVGNEVNFRSSRGIIVRRTLRQLSDDIKQKLLTGNKGRWKKLSPWTTARTGRVIPLQKLAGRIKTRTTRGRAQIYFEETSKAWSLTSHHRGFHVSATRGKFMRVPMLSAAPVVFFNRRAYNVPARPIWPSERTATTALNRNIRAFIQHIERGSSTTFRKVRL